MVGKENKKCAKCGITSKEAPSLTFHRFPQTSKHGSLKAKVWAKYSFPDSEWTEASLNILYSQHKMLCGNHFDDSSFTSSDRKRLNKFAIPTEAKSILNELRGDPLNVEASQPVIEPDAIASTSSSNFCLVTLDKNSNEKTNLLKDLSVKKIGDLSPRKKKLYKRCRRNLSEIIRLRKRVQKIKKSKRCTLETLSKNEFVDDLIKNRLSSSFYLLLQSQLKNVPRKLTGRRWTLEDKVLALSIFKKSSSCYRLLSKLFCLPSVSSLKALLNRIPMVSGINKQILKTIKEITENRDESENLCVLAFDEMSIRKNLSYNIKLDQIDGYQDHAGQGRTSQIASHALTFMAIGVRKSWKQPIAFYFSGENVTADRLAVLIKEVLSACFNSGLIVIGTICDLDGVNIRAINSLGSSRDKPYFVHEGHEIVTVLDPPHLLKCFRNNFLKHDIQFSHSFGTEETQNQGVAKWSHIEDFYKKDNENPNFVFAPALTLQHLNPNGRQKMKVRLAAQVLSHSVAAGIYAKVGQSELPQDAIYTAIVVSHMDKLFDSVNGDTPDRKKGKQLLTNMSSTSPHVEYFEKMKLFFKDLKFLGARSRPPSQDGWLRTINAIERIYNNLKKINIKTLAVRRLNQDPLENCFGCIRSNCGCNPNPTTVQFVAALKTSIITNLINNNNKNRNCLDDKNDVLDNFKIYLKQNVNDKENVTPVCMPINNVDVNNNADCLDLEMPQCSGEMQACAYICGFIIKYLNINCITCKNIMLADQNTEVCHLFTSFKEYCENKISLNYVQSSFCEMVEKAATIINNYLRDNSHKENVKGKLKMMCEVLDTDWLKGCEEHYSFNCSKIIESAIAICIKQFCRIKNEGFIEEASKKMLKRKMNILHNI